MYGSLQVATKALEQGYKVVAVARHAMTRAFNAMNGTQAGDPAKLAKGLIKVVNSEDAPIRLLISKGAIPAIDAYYKTRYAEFEKWQEVSTDSDFEQ